jgi:hypothetical protein
MSMQLSGNVRGRAATGRRVRNPSAVVAIALVALLGWAVPGLASELHHKVERTYVKAPDAEKGQSPDAVDAKNQGCMSCHTQTDSPSMHRSSGVNLACVDCHGGDASVTWSGGHTPDAADYISARDSAHVLPSYPDDWLFPSSRNPEVSYTLLNREAPEYVRFVNPSDYRVVEEACGACHLPVIQAAKRSIMATGAMLWGGAAYNNGILPFKNYLLGEAYTRDGKPSGIAGPELPDMAGKQVRNGIAPLLLPLPAWETIRPGDAFRIFERGGRNILNLFPETGIPNSLGLMQRLEEPGRPDFRQSNRGPGTGLRIAVPVINITKTRLNDPLMWYLGTNENPGDYRTSGCGACHVVYANDRDPRHSGPYAKAGNVGQTTTIDPTISREESGHPLEHSFTRSIPTSQCMSCHMHQPNMFVNTYLGYTMWDYESDAPFMFPKKQRYPTSSEIRAVNERNPEGAAVLGLWSDPKFLQDVSLLNPQLQDTQFADYHGHGWNFRAIFKRDRQGNLLDAEGHQVSNSDPDKFKKAVHMSSIHLDVGMHCADCHFSQDSHGNGHIYTEVSAAVEIDCVDCHGTAEEYPTLRTSGPAAPPRGRDLSLLRNPDGRLRFEWVNGKLYQRGLINTDKEWELSLVKDTVTPGHAQYNAKAARAKLMSRNPDTQHWGPDVPPAERAHGYDTIECYACHQSWTTSCGGCHLPIQANWLTERHHYEGGITRNYATYNPQVARDEIFMLGRRGKIDGGRIAPLRSTSALVLSSTNSSRERIYIQQPPVASSGYSSQAINPHFAHTVRKTETRECTDCHLSKNGDNNAIMAQTLGYGTDFIDFIGFNAWVGTAGSVEAVQVTEWEEPQAVIGSFLHKYVYPDFYAAHQENGRVLKIAHAHKAENVQCLQLRGEYLYAAVGSEGFRAYDVAGIANKGLSQRILTSPVGPLGQETRIKSTNATCMALATTQPVHPDRNVGKLMREANQEKPFHPIYKYVFITDSVEGLILTDYQTLGNAEPRDNFLTRALTWNEGGVLNGARHITIGGRYLYIMADAGLVVIDANEPLRPKHVATVPLNGGKASHLQFRYLFVTDSDGVKAVDVTDPTRPRLVPDNTIALSSAHGIFVSRTYAYVGGGSQGLVIVDVSKPEAMRLHQVYNANGALQDTRDVAVATTNASLMAYVADGTGGLKVVQLTSPESQPNFYGFAVEPRPELIASYPTDAPALGVSRGLERDRAVDEDGGQVAIFGRIGSGPLSKEDMLSLYMKKDGNLWFVTDDAEGRSTSGWLKAGTSDDAAVQRAGATSGEE